MGIDHATCDYEGCTAEGTVEDYDHQWWCTLHWWRDGDYNDDSLHNLRIEMDKAIKKLHVISHEYQDICMRFAATEVKVNTLEAQL